MTRRIPKKSVETEFDSPASAAFIEDIRALDESRITADLKAIVQESEDMRMNYMRSVQGRRFMTITFGMLAGLAAAGGFGWFFLMQYDLERALLCLVPAFVVPLLLHFWSERPIKRYRRDFKTEFMPRLAQALGGFRFHSQRGVSAKILAHTGIVPPHEPYKAEDCFLGVYKGVKVIFSEARLFTRKSREPVFRGLFVLLELPQSVFEGHTIITADHQMVKQWSLTRWRNLSPVKIESANPAWNRFTVYADKPDIAKILCGEKLLKELSEACDAFGGAMASAAFFGGKYMFMMVPEKKDMFEACEIHVPVTVRSYAADFRREIIRLLEIIDIFDIYRSGTN
ncbi:MAG: DUF3137 domain-containing protein [Alphaproteobacteria bacterium]